MTRIRILSRNNFVGTIPDSILGCTELTELYVFLFIYPCTNLIRVVLVLLLAINS